MIEHLAQTLKTALKGYDAGNGLILIGERHNEDSLREIARTVLLEMRSPTDGMRRAGSVFFVMEEADAAEAATIVYGKMIDAALAE